MYCMAFLLSYFLFIILCFFNFSYFTKIKFLLLAFQTGTCLYNELIGFFQSVK